LEVKWIDPSSMIPRVDDLPPGLPAVNCYILLKVVLFSTVNYI
jgi:hypothetical protein